MAWRNEGPTAAEVILLAARDLAASGKTAFSEWDLTVATWKRANNRFGCRGYESVYPDHKRVMMEIMGKTKRDNPVRRGFLRKVRPNYYELTPLGLAEADKLSRAVTNEPAAMNSPGPVFTSLERYVSHTSFRAWQADRNEPHSWLGAAAFWGIAHYDPAELSDKLRQCETAIRQAEAWCRDHGVSAITRGPHGGGEIQLDEVKQLREFTDVLKERFARQIDSIRQKKNR